MQYFRTVSYAGFIVAALNFTPAAGAATISFEGVAADGGAAFPSSAYQESGYALSVPIPNGAYWGIYDSAFATSNGVVTNGTDGLALAAGTALTLSADGDAPFSLFSFDAASLFSNQFAQGMSIGVTGYLAGGGEVFEEFQIIENTFSTFVLSLAFTNLASVDFVGSAPNPNYNLDNLVVALPTDAPPPTAAVPLPGTLGLLALGLAGIAATRRKPV